MEASLRRRFRVVETAVPIHEITLNILHPASAEELIDEVDFARDERLPYWAELWPSAQALGSAVIRMTGAGRTLLELGCGAGLVSTSAAVAGFDVVASDYYEDACLFAQVNAKRNGDNAVRGLLLDWRDMPPNMSHFDVVVASDVLYERPYAALVASAVNAALADGGEAYVADPGRVALEDFVAALCPLGLRVRRRSNVPFEAGSIRQTIAILEIVRDS